MNYPVWDVAFGAGMLIAMVATLRVFVSHFAVGGGLFLVITERRARRNNDTALLGWLKRHTKCVALVAFGAMASFEFVRESIRLPYVISNYLYANSLYATPIPGDGGFSVDEVSSTGVLPTAKWIGNRTLTPHGQIAVGHEIFRVECASFQTEALPDNPLRRIYRVRSAIFNRHR